VRLSGVRGARRGLAAAALVLAAAVTVWLATASARAINPGPSGLAMPQRPPVGWKIVFADNFTGSSLGSEWNEYSGEPGNDPGGWWGPSHDVVAHGDLQLQTYPDARACQASAGCRSYDGEVSGGLKLQIPETYGRYLVRLRAADAKGVSVVALLWPANDGFPPEIDFVEDNGVSPRRLATATLHYGADDTEIHKTLPIDLARWHTYGVVWSPGSISYTVDGHPWASISGAEVPSQPMELAIQTQTWDCGLQWEHCAGSGPAPHTSLDVGWVVIEEPVGAS
jgi:hypothetical protein